MKNKKHWRFSIPIYDCTVHLIVTDDVSAMWRKYPDPFSAVRSDDKCQAFYVSNFPNFTIVIKPTSPLSDVAHEIGHVSRAIMNTIGFKIASDNDEPLAYLEDFITKKIHNIIVAPRRQMLTKKKS